MTKTTYTGEEVKAMLKEAGILHYQAAERLGITQNYFSVRLKGEFTDIECHLMGILPALDYSGPDMEKDLKIIIQHYWPELMAVLRQHKEILMNFQEAVDIIKKDHCQTVIIWDYIHEKENEPC